MVYCLMYITMVDIMLTLLLLAGRNNIKNCVGRWSRHNYRALLSCDNVLTGGVVGSQFSVASGLQLFSIWTKLIMKKFNVCGLNLGNNKLGLSWGSARLRQFA